MKRIALILAVVGCVETANEPLLEPTFGPPLIDEELQGRHLLGSFPDTLLANNRHFRVSNIPANRPAFTLSVMGAGPLGANGANLIATDGTSTYTHADSWFVGLVMTGVAGGQLKITAAAPRGSSTSYTLEYRDAANPTWVDYCDGAGGSIALHGGFNERRIHTTGLTISFACDDGVAAKCNDWGYVAGTGGAGNIDWDHHQACIQMANAAYCGGAESGLPFTREETPIVIQDYRASYAKGDPTLTHPAVFPGDPDTHYFEAAWRPNGLAPLCLSQLRWASLPPHPCPAMLPDPRFSPDPEAKFCEEMTYADLQAAGALIINGSKMMDAPLHRWRNPGTGDTVTTMRGFYSNILGNQSESIAPFPGYTEYVAPDGMILRNLTGTLDPAVDMSELFVQHDNKSGHLVVSDGVALTDHSYDPARTVDFEGYAFKDPTRVAGLTTLKVCHVGGNYDTTIGACVPGSSAMPMYALPAP